MIVRWPISECDQLWSWWYHGGCSERMREQTTLRLHHDNFCHVICVCFPRFSGRGRRLFLCRSTLFFLLLSCSLPISPGAPVQRLNEKGGAYSMWLFFLVERRQKWLYNCRKYLEKFSHRRIRLLRSFEKNNPKRNFKKNYPKTIKITKHPSFTQPLRWIYIIMFLPSPSFISFPWPLSSFTFLLLLLFFFFFFFFIFFIKFQYVVPAPPLSMTIWILIHKNIFTLNKGLNGAQNTHQSKTGPKSGFKYDVYVMISLA